MRTYSIEEKLSGQDLHGLPCRVPKLTPEQEKCSHTRIQEYDDGYEDGNGNWHSEWKSQSISMTEDIPGTNNFRCTRCGYIRRY